MDRYRAAAIREKGNPSDKLVGPDMPTDFGYHYPKDFVEQSVTMLTESNWISWPYPGTWADQPAYLVDDILMCLKLQRRAKWEAENGIVSTALAQDTVDDSSNGKKYRL